LYAGADWSGSIIDYLCMQPEATSVCDLKLLVYEALSY
jgi:hypothetical protein